MASTTGTSNSIFDLPEDGMIGSSGSTGSECRKGSDLAEVPHERRYLQGDELHRHRKRVLGMRQSLHEARDTGNTVRVQQLSRAVLTAQQLDGEFMYQVSLERMEAASQAGLQVEAEKYRKEAQEARASLPQFQLEGLWVGKYGDTFQMVNVSYTGDVLTAHKVTGDRHVPKGEITFQVDLSPTKEYLDPIELSSDAVEQWGSKYLQRHAGQGQVAADGFVNSQWLDGQLILVNQYFSFAWLPTGHQVFFGRPSAELTLKLLRESVTGYAQPHSHSSGIDDPNPRQYLARCMEETELLDDDMEVSDGIFRSHDQHYYYDQAGCFE
jgi:Cyclin D1 binding domain